MPNATSTENNFTKGLLTEFTGLNFPENAATETSNCIYTLIGDVTRREGINEEVNGNTQSVSLTNQAINSYVWNNPGGDGNSKLLVKQVGGTLYFYDIATSTVASPLSTQLLTGTAALVASGGGSLDSTKECEFADGNGWLFVYHPSCDPAYVTYNPVLTSVALNPITVKIRDFYGLNDGLNVNTRPSSLSTEHNYNIQNQGWTSSNSFFQQSQTSINITVGSHNFAIASGLTIANGTIMNLVANVLTYTKVGSTYFADGNCQANMVGSVTGYSGTTLTINIYSVSTAGGTGIPGNPFPTQFGGDGITYFPETPSGTYYLFTPWNISSVNTSTINTWNSDEGNYPSNADVWWYFKDTTGTFNPTTVQPNVTLSTGNAPQGHFVLPAFNLDRTAASGITGITPVTTTSRPSTGCWFQGRVWYTGNNAQSPATGDASYYTWTENIYFSQIVSNTVDFGNCYQTNDPTSENLFDLLPTDGGVITITGCGTIHKLFPIANGMLVFANNGVWFITGSQGIGFSANDYTITKISSVKVLSSKSFVDVLGLPYFWNEEGIYAAVQGQSGQLGVEPLTVGTILTYYNNIPLSSKKYARGDYDPINYIIQWCFKSTVETGVTDRYQYDSILNFNIYNKAFYPYNLTTTSSLQYIHGVKYVSYPYISSATPEPGFKYGYSITQNAIGFADEHDTTFVDWGSVNFESFFVTGYKLHGSGIFKFQIPYVLIYNRLNGVHNAYTIQSVWDYANTGNSGKWSTAQYTDIFNLNFDMQIKRHRLRGRGYALQIRVNSVPGLPFDIMGWSLFDNINAGV